MICINILFRSRNNYFSIKYVRQLSDNKNTLYLGFFGESSKTSRTHNRRNFTKLVEKVSRTYTRIHIFADDRFLQCRKTFRTNPTTP